MTRILRVLIFFFPFRSVREAFPFYLFGSPSRVFWTVSPQARRWRRNVCSRGGGALSVVAGFIPIPGSRSGKRPVVELNAAGSRSVGSIRNGGTSTPIYFRGTYALQKEKYGTRAEEKRRYREQHPDCRSDPGETRTQAEDGSRGCSAYSEAPAEG